MEFLGTEVWGELGEKSNRIKLGLIILYGSIETIYSLRYACHEISYV